MDVITYPCRDQSQTILVKGATGRLPGGHLRGSQAGTLPSRRAATTHPRAGQAQIGVCECPSPEGPPRPDTDEKAPLRAGHQAAVARRRCHCQSTEFHVLHRQMVNIWRYLLRHFCRCHIYHQATRIMVWRHFYWAIWSYHISRLERFLNLEHAQYVPNK